MRIVDDLDGFIQDFKTGSACLLTGIRNIAYCLDTLDEKLKEDHPVTEITDLIWKDLRGICPVCCMWSKAETLTGVQVISTFGRDRTLLMGYGDKSRLLDGHCINPQCSSHEILIVWKGAENIEQQIEGHLERIRTTAKNKRDTVQLKYIEKLASPELLAFTEDTIFAIQLNCTTSHMYIRRTFPNLVVWVSAIPYGMPGVATAFPYGYKAFLDQLLSESGYQRGDVSIAHWISILPISEHEQSILNLTFVPEKNLSGSEQFLILPFEVVAGAERDTLKARGMVFLKNCYFCGEEIPENTVVCPWCGRRQTGHSGAFARMKRESP